MTKLYTATVKSAYGKKYITGRDARLDFEKGKDFFSIFHNRYMSIRDCAPGCIVEIRYGNSNDKSTSYTVQPQPQPQP